MPQVTEVVFVLLILFLPTITWSQVQSTDQADPLEYVQQSPTSQDHPAPAAPSDSGAVSLPGPAPASQDKKDDSQGKQTKRMFGVVPNFAAVSANTQLPPLSTREKFSLAAHDSVVDYSSFTWAGILAAQALALNSNPELGNGIAGYGRYYWRTFTDGVSGTFSPRRLFPQSGTRTHGITPWAKEVFGAVRGTPYLGPSSQRQILEARVSTTLK